MRRTRVAVVGYFTGRYQFAEVIPLEFVAFAFAQKCSALTSLRACRNLFPLLPECDLEVAGNKLGT